MMSREHSAIIKGIGILFMMICHLVFVSGGEHLNNAFFHTLTNASHMINYCLIISGYGLYLVYEKGRLSWSYLCRRSLRLYIALWLILLIFPVLLGSVLYPGRFSYSWYKLITNFTGVRWDYCNFTWFLLPYVLMVFSSKAVFKMIDKVGNIMSFFIGAALYLVSTWLISRFFVAYFSEHFLIYQLVLVAQTLFGLIIGAIMARIVLSGKSLKIPFFEDRSWLVLLLFLVLYVLRGQIHSAALNPFFAIIVILAVVNIEWPRPVARFFSALGNQLMLMWLVQGFVGAFMFKEYYQPLHWPALIWVAWVTVTYLTACLLKPITNRLNSLLKLSKA